MKLVSEYFISSKWESYTLTINLNWIHLNWFFFIWTGAILDVSIDDILTIDNHTDLITFLRNFWKVIWQTLYLSPENSPEINLYEII